MGGIDKRDRFAEAVSPYRAKEDGSVFIEWQGRHVTTLRGRAVG